MALAGAVLCATVTLGGLSPAPSTAQEPDEAADLRAAVQAQRDEAAAQLDDAEDALAAANRAVAGSEEALADLRRTRDEVAGAAEATRVAREEPLAVRRAVAVEIYMAGDPAAQGLLDELVEGGTGVDAVADRALYTSVIDWATATLERLDAELAELLAELDRLDGEIPELEELLAAQRIAARDELTARDELIVRIADLDMELRRLSRAILTGLEVDEVPTRPILVVKIDNVSGARPQHGLDVADIVIEERVESGLTRLAALYQSTGADPVGPVRSARTSDVHLLANLGAPLFAFSGANLGVGASVSSSPLVDIGATTHGQLYYRDSSRRAPHNLMSRTGQLWAAGQGASPPLPIFEFREPGEPIGAGARPAAGVDVNYGSARASFSWDPDRNGWARTQDGTAHTVVGGAQIAPQNVVVRFLSYQPSPADARSPEAVVSGSGPLWVLSDGQVVEGRWEQDTTTSPTRWLDANGDPIHLTPGRTWILLPEPGRATLR